jgi:DNA-binding GntR family transcriptional regulator
MEFAYSQLRDKVLTGDLKPGDRLVNRTLGEELGVSTVTIREAIHRLASDGVVEHVPNAGAYVRKLSSGEMVDLFSFRAWLDVFTVKEAVRRIERHELGRLQSLCNDMRDIIVAMRDLPNRLLDGAMMDRWLELDRRFHRLMVDAAHNSWLTKATDDIHLLSHVMKAKGPTTSFRDAVWTYRQHAEITKALHRRDEAQAREWMRIHGDQALATLLIDLEDRGVYGDSLPGLDRDAVGAGIAKRRFAKN